jgi:phosphoenolpyruvate synthase/pyruvate phosphate dikinase
METIVKLSDATTGFGGKAKHLAALLSGGFDVPEGFAIAPDAPLDGIAAQLSALGDVAVAVRSSAIDEDGAMASFAGIYGSVIDVRGVAAVHDAVARVFARAVAVVTDGGSVAAHASLVAREYGIPAVVGTVDATQQLHDGQLVTVDGTTGRVELLNTTP